MGQLAQPLAFPLGGGGSIQPVEPTNTIGPLDLTLQVDGVRTVFDVVDAYGNPITFVTGTVYLVLGGKVQRRGVDPTFSDGSYFREVGTTQIEVSEAPDFDPLGSDDGEHEEVDQLLVFCEVLVGDPEAQTMPVLEGTTNDCELPPWIHLDGCSDDLVVDVERRGHTLDTLARALAFPLGTQHEVTKVSTVVRDLTSQISRVTGGTVLLTNGSTSVVGTGTTFTSLPTTKPYIKVGESETEPQVDLWGAVASVTDDLNLELAEPYLGVTASIPLVGMSPVFFTPDVFVAGTLHLMVGGDAMRRTNDPTFASPAGYFRELGPQTFEVDPSDPPTCDPDEITGDPVQEHLLIQYEVVAVNEPTDFPVLVGSTSEDGC